MPQRTMRIGLRFILLVTLGSVFLAGCADVAMTGAQALYNRHTIQKNVGDQYITMQAYKTLHIDTDKFKDTNITIATYNREVLLAGQVPHEWQRAEAQKLVKEIPNIDQVYNLITISNPSSTLTRMSDSWITTKVKAQLMASNDVDATQVKVVTENGTVYLMGILQPSEAEAAVDVARNTQGVTRVVKIFSYMHISKA